MNVERGDIGYLLEACP